MLNRGDGTFAALQQYTAGPNCAGLAVDVTLGDVTQPAPPAGGGNDTSPRATALATRSTAVVAATR
jgi:hypothetical protein